MNVGIAFDDFGTGYASLTLLKQLAITRLKIDRSFIRDIETDRKDQGIVDAVVRMARGCDLEVIAEGIETRAQADYLRERLSEGQGYLFGSRCRWRAFPSSARDAGRSPAPGARRIEIAAFGPDPPGSRTERRRCRPAEECGSHRDSERDARRFDRSVTSW